MRIGVVTPAYDVAPWIATAIASVRAQTHADWRMVVVDDGSRDGTSEIVEGVRDERLTLLRQANAGVSAARYAGQIDFSPAARAALAEAMNADRLRACLDTLAQDHGRPDLPAVLRQLRAEQGDGVTVLQEASATGGALAVAHAWDPAAETLVVTDIHPV
jgi:glycosyltransferase involved in cell wall biosynthesis